MSCNIICSNAILVTENIGKQKTYYTISLSFFILFIFLVVCFFIYIKDNIVVMSSSSILKKQSSLIRMCYLYL
jgi:hypothetical protein